MELIIIKHEFAICKLNDLSEIDYTNEFFFIGKTDEEVSLVCMIDSIPNNTIVYDKTWKAFKIEGVLDFSLIGILSSISKVLAENKIGIFAISSFNTDYIFTKAENFNYAIDVLRDAGFEITGLI